jgi:Mesyanzhinovviridae DNA polymerase I
VKKVIFDFETRSEVDLRKTGAYKYSLHQSTRPTCMAFKIHGEDKIYFMPFHVINRIWKDQDPKIKDLWRSFIAGEFVFVGHNVFFERCIYTNILVARYGWPPIPARRLRCTAAKAAACALPRSLEGAGEALGLRIQKDRRGYFAMMATCKPTRKYKDWIQTDKDLKDGRKVGPKRMKAHTAHCPSMFLEPEDDPDTFKTLYDYCKIDVRAEEVLDDSLPDLSPEELENWHHNQLLNWRGLRFDKPTVEKVVGIMTSDSGKKLEILDGLTMGLVRTPGCIASILEFLEDEGVELPNLQAKTIDDALKTMDLSDRARGLLEIRKALSMASTKKYMKFLERGTDDGRVRDILLYHAASTGREGGVGINPNNFPRGLLKVDSANPYAAVNDVVEWSEKALKFFYGEDSLGVVFSAILRNMIIPTDGYEMFVADFSKIEVAILWWLAGNDPGLETLRAGKDPYIYQAAMDLKKSYEEIEEAVKAEEKWALDARQRAKAEVLGCGYGMGPPKFMATAWSQHRLRLTEKQSKMAVYSYRNTNPSVPVLWERYEAAARCALKNPRKKYSTNKCKFYLEEQFLKVELPSGRRLSYLRPQIAWRESPWRPGETMETIEYWGVDKSRKKIQLERTWGGTFTENICQAIARDLMMPALRRLEKNGYRALLSVYDEGLCEKKIGEGSTEEFSRIMAEIPPWGQGLPVEAKGWVGPRYKKG